MGWHRGSRVSDLVRGLHDARCVFAGGWRVRSNESTIVASPAVALPVCAFHGLMPRDPADSNGQQNTETARF